MVTPTWRHPQGLCGTRKASNQLGPLALLKCHGGAQGVAQEHRVRIPPSRKGLAQPLTSCVTQGRPLALSEPISSQTENEKIGSPGTVGLWTAQAGRASRAGKCQGWGDEAQGSSSGQSPQPTATYRTGTFTAACGPAWPGSSAFPKVSHGGREPERWWPLGPGQSGCAWTMVVTAEGSEVGLFENIGR